MGHYCRNFDFGVSIDDIVHAAREFGEQMKEMGSEFSPFWFDPCCGTESGYRHEHQPHVYFYPPTNVYTTSDGSIVLEFSLAGFDESSVSISFQGDYLVLSAKAPDRGGETEANGHHWRGFRPRDVDKQKYRVPSDGYLQDQARAVFKNGLLTVTVPPKEPEGASIKVEIVKEGN
jgi:HSP20 family molecular chaperone IbpA